ncbi:TRAP transporter substrate-binding protein [Oleidesulfovibrio sp.]|uniref:TRAP transporter substrate-binding protein n=1 Tax=Oleidesulfovibrio sp. TaxID=2909707 RepID=UPI003A8B7690
MKRRDFLKTAGAGMAAGVAVNAVSAPAVLAGQKFQWKMITSWPPGMPILQTGAERFAKLVSEMSDGDLTIEVFAGGELVPPLGVFDAVSQGMVQCYHSASYYWAGKHPGTQWFTSVPFGMNSTGYNAWFNSGDGLKLWEELYAKFNLMPRPLGATSFQMGGWFNKKINSIEDLKGLKLRFPGLAGKVYDKAGASIVLLPGSEVYTSLERGVIDGTDWVGPVLDKRMGLNRVAKYYYIPGWQEPTGYTEVVFNKAYYDQLPADLKGVIDGAAAKMTATMLGEFDIMNARALAELKKEGGIEVVEFPQEVLDTFRSISAEVLEQEADKDPMARKIHDNYKAFMADWLAWAKVTDGQYYSRML